MSTGALIGRSTCMHMNASQDSDVHRGMLQAAIGGHQVVAYDDFVHCHRDGTVR
jgi:hypothetical protein